MEWRGMKTVFATVLSTMLCTPLLSQNYYVVVGAFATEKSDIKQFTSYLPGQSSDTAYTVQSDGSLMHFYVWKTSNKEMAMARSMQLQGEIEKKQNAGIALEQKVYAPIIELGPPPSEVVVGMNGSQASVEVSSGGGVPAKPKGKYFKFTIATKDGDVFPAQIHEVDAIQGRELAAYASNINVDVLKPGRNQETAMVCGVFGYKEVEKYIDYSHPEETEGAYQDEQGVWIIPYTLERLSKGDVSVMYNVSFYKDAVVMLPTSQNDLDELVRMMTANPNYVIKVHAHCNGKNSRKIIAMGENNNYFDVNGSLEIEGSAKQLSNLRGEAVRNYLADHGIAPERVKIYGWGGTEMLVEKESPHAKINDRIEIEILKD